MARDPRTAPAEAAVAGLLGTSSRDPRGRGQRPRGDSRAPGGRPRDQGGDGDRARHDPGEARGSPPAGSWSLDAWAPGSWSAHRPPLLRVAPARVASQGQQPQLPADEEVGEGGWPGGGGEAWRPRAESAAASTARGGWDTLRLRQARQETFRPGRETPKQTAVKRRCPPASALAPLNLPPARPHDWPQTRPTSPRTGCEDPKPGRHDRSGFPRRRRHLSLPCQRRPP